MPKRDVDESDSEFIRHISCPACGSTDANSLYSDGHTFCFACGAFGGDASATRSSSQPARRVSKDLLSDVEVEALRARGINEKTCEHFGYGKTQYKGKTVQVAPYYDADGVLVAQHIRGANKKFAWIGDPKEALPFGAKNWQKTGKMIVVTEGEIDALSMSQVQGNKWPVVSIGCGAGPQIKKYFAKHKAYFSGFEKVILMFDMDEPGRRASKEAAEVLGGIARIAEMPLKDANEMLIAGKVPELIDAMWKAKEYTPEGIVNMADLRAQAKIRPAMGLSYPWQALTDMTYGIRLAEIVTLGAGTGVGKTDIVTQIAAHLVVEHKVPIGCFFLEQSPTESSVRIAGKVAGKRFHIPDAGWEIAELDEAWDFIEESGQVYLYDSFGQNDWDKVQAQIEYLHHAHGIQYFFLDNLTALAAWQDDERQALEQIMSEMSQLVVKLNITIFLVSHLATPEGKSHEEGGRVTIRHFKGSRAVGFWSFIMLGLERNQQAEDETDRNSVLVRGLKDRYTGRAVGKTFLLRYDELTGLLHEADVDSEQFADAGEDGDF